MWMASVFAALIGCMSFPVPAAASGDGYADVVLADRPVGYWRFEEDASSEVAVSSAAGSESVNGTYHNVTLGNKSATPALGSAAGFTADLEDKSYVDLGSPQALMLRGDLTIEWWQYATHDDTKDRAIICWARPGESSGDNVLYEMVLRYSREQKGEKYPRPQLALGHEYGGGKNVRVSSMAVTHPNKWYHVVAVRDAHAKTIRYYINGLPSGEPQSYSEAHDNPQGGEAGGAAIGRLGRFDRRYFKGLLDEVAIYDHTLSEERVMAHYRAALGKADGSNRVQVVGHRGNNRFAPENTLVSYAQAIQLQTPIVEMDLHRSKDGVIVLLHDDTLDRTTNGSGRVTGKTLAQLKELDAGLWKDPRYAGETIPTLQEIAELCKGRAIMMLDLKDPVTGDEIAEVLTRTGIAEDQIIVAPWKAEQASGLRPYLPDAPMVLLHSKPPSAYTGDDSFFEDMKAMGFNGFSLKWMHLPKTFVDAAHRHGMQVHTWTVNRPEDISGAILMGIDGIITDDPAATAAYVARVMD
jgi:glycerophosphoryl diester phosphodiesterase